MREQQDHHWMARALEVARSGWGVSRPNPSVGAVVVQQGHEIAAGYSQPVDKGGAHAEVVALRSAGELCRGATLYVTLEPCSHFGKSPPCTQAIIAAGVGRVVIGVVDQNPLVSGSGVAQLRQAGLQVTIENLGGDVDRLYSGFFHWVSTGLPLIHFKLAVDSHGGYAAADGSPLAITGKEAQQWSHTLRAQCDGVLISSRTALNDNPQLNSRSALWHPPTPPARLVLGQSVDLPAELRLFAEDGAAVALYGERLGSRHPQWVAQQQIPHQSLDRTVRQLVEQWGREGRHQLLIEGGGYWTALLLRSGVVDRFYLLRSRLHFPGALSVDPQLFDLLREVEIARFAPVGDDTLYEYRPVRDL